jgi:hypothetical protein
MSIRNPFDSLIRFLNAKTILRAEIHHQLVEVREEGVRVRENKRFTID